MKKTTCNLLFLMLLSFASSITFAQKNISKPQLSPSGINRCYSNEYEEYLRQQNPKMETRAQFETWIAYKITEQKENQASSSQSGGVIYIPVVVHVIHNGDAYGTGENITDEQVQSQITVMTQDFRKMTGTPGFNSNPIGADTSIEFVLAKVDPNGNPTNGIDRVNLCTESWARTAIDTNLKPATIWDPLQYMNMWSVRFTDATLLGYAQFPSSSGLAGLNVSGGAANTDGVVATFNTFGSRTIFPAGNYGGTQYDKGRTMTHEVGHFLGLRHLWGDVVDCTGSDYCADTPDCSDQYYAGAGVPTGCAGPTQCSGVRQVENYMDYSDDSCMNIFTTEQKTRITAVMTNSPRRVTLKTSTKDLPIALFANDAEVKVDGVCNAGSSGCTPTPNQHKILLYNRGTTNLTSASINYNEGGANTSFNWTGSLLPNKYAIIPINAVLTTGTLNVSIATTNGVTDQRASNDTAAKAFTFPAVVTPTNYLYTAFTFTLVGDRYGSETTWNLKNAAGTTLYSGGPYTDRTVNGTQNLVTNQAWTLPTDGCYTFTILDSQNDGINSTPTNYGAGFYNIKTNSGAITVISNTTFATASATNTFTNKTLSAADFEFLEGINLYPNPTTTNIKIAILNNTELPTKFEIFNSIGQSIKKQIINNESDLSINTNAFSNGIYFIKIEKDGAFKTLQFMKN